MAAGTAQNPLDAGNAGRPHGQADGYACIIVIYGNDRSPSRRRGFVNLRMPAPYCPG